jgi:sterol desaturase/sphingolipid hydroxylase (fatty acid hydroxylase superfamily)
MNIFTSRREHPFDFTSKGAAFVMIVVSLLINPVQDIHRIHGWSDYLSVNQHILIVNLIVLFVVKIIPAINHSNIYLNYPGFLRYIFVSPVHHTIHHVRNIHNKNFGGFLSLWDYLFGTFVNVPNKSFFKSVNKSLGDSNVGDQDISNIIDALVHPFKR